MNKKANSWLIGCFMLILALGIFALTILPCISGGAPYDINKATNCMFNFNSLILIAIAIIIGTLGSFICYNSKP